MSVVKQMFSEISSSETTLEIDDIQKLLKDIDINSATNKLERAVSKRKVKIISTNNLIEKSNEINLRFNGIKFNRVINHLIGARYFGYSCFEIIYNKDFQIDNLIPIPHENIEYNNKIWQLKIGSKEMDLNRDKFLLSINRWSPGNPTGKSIFESINKTFLDKETYTKQLRGISKAYGDIVVIYPFDIDSTEEEKEELKKRMETSNKKSAIGVPIRYGDSIELKKTIDFIKLSDLDPEIYTKLEEREKKKLTQNILGGTLTIEASSAEGNGTNALGTVHQEGFNEVVEEICSFVSDSLFQLLEIDAMYHGYNAKDFKIILEEEVSESEIIKKNKTKEELNANKLENLLKLKNIGYTLSKKALSDILGIDEKDLEEHEEKGILEFSSLSSKKKINFLKEKVELNNDIFDECIEKSIDIFTKDISGQLKEKLLKVKKPIDIEKITLDFNLLKEKLILSHLKGFIDDSELNLNEFSDDVDPFNLKYEKAIQYFLNKKPALIDDLEEINNKVLEQVFYIKRSTEIETTKKLYSSLLSNMEEGKTFKNWLGDSEEVLNKSGLLNNPYYLEIVYRNNMNSAYNAGAFHNQELNRENKPYGLYDAVGDNRTSSICKSLDEKVYPLDHVFWKNYLPPNHHYCRSRRIALSKEEVKDYGFKISKSITKDIKGLKDKMGNFYGDHLSGLRKLVKAKEKELLKLKALDKNGIIKEEPKTNKALYKLSNKMSQKAFGTQILKNIGLEDLEINIKKMSSRGTCQLSFSEFLDKNNNPAMKLIIKNYNLQSNDKRPMIYKRKTAFHEAYHALGHNQLTDFIQRRTQFQKWAYMDDVFAESSAHYMMKAYGNKIPICPAYSEYLIETLPKLKKLPKFSNCKTIEDFGKIAWEERIQGGGSKWGSLISDLKKIKIDKYDYSKQYLPYLEKNKNKIFALVYRNQSSNDKKFLMDLIQSTINDFKENVELDGNQEICFDMIIGSAMKLKGVM